MSERKIRSKLVVAPGGSVRLAGLAATGLYGRSLLVAIAFGLGPVLYLTLQSSSETSLFVSMAVNVLVVVFGSFIARVSLDEQTGLLLRQTKDEFRLDVSLMVCALIVGATAVEIAHTMSRPIEISFEEHLLFDVSWVILGLVLGLFILHYGIGLLKQISGCLSAGMSYLVLTLSVFLLFAYLAKKTEFVINATFLPEALPARAAVLTGIWVVSSAALSELVLTAVRWARHEDYFRRAKPDEKTQSPLSKIVLYLLLLLTILGFMGKGFFSVSVDEPSDKGDLSPVSTVSEEIIVLEPSVLEEEAPVDEVPEIPRASTENPTEDPPPLSFLGFHNWAYLAPDSGGDSALPWSALGFRLEASDTLEDGRAVATLVVPAGALEEICTRDILIVGAAASLSGLEGFNQRLSAERTKHLLDLFGRHVSESGAPACEGKLPLLFGLALGQYQPPSGTPDSADQRRPMIIALEADFEDGEIDPAAMAAALLDETVVRYIESQISGLCLGHYPNAKLKLETGGVPNSPAVPLRFAQGASCFSDPIGQ